MGALARVAPIFAEETKQAVDTFHQCGIRVIAAALERSMPLAAAGTAFPGGMAVLIGNEGSGLAPQTVAAADLAVVTDGKTVGEVSREIVERAGLRVSLP